MKKKTFFAIIKCVLCIHLYKKLDKKREDFCYGFCEQYRSILSFPLPFFRTKSNPAKCTSSRVTNARRPGAIVATSFRCGYKGWFYFVYCCYTAPHILTLQKFLCKSWVESRDVSRFAKVKLYKHSNV